MFKHQNDEFMNNEKENNSVCNFYHLNYIKLLHFFIYSRQNVTKNKTEQTENHRISTLGYCYKSHY